MKQNQKYQNMHVGQNSNTRIREIFIFEVISTANIERFYFIAPYTDIFIFILYETALLL
jgi:hypothetical protein